MPTKRFFLILLCFVGQRRIACSCYKMNSQSTEELLWRSASLDAVDEICNRESNIKEKKRAAFSFFSEAQ